MKLNRWIVYGNCLVGYIFDDPKHPAGTRVITDAIRYIDPVNAYAETLDGKYKLEEQGTQQEHDEPLLGEPKTKSAVVAPGAFLNPSG